MLKRALATIRSKRRDAALVGATRKMLNLSCGVESIKLSRQLLAAVKNYLGAVLHETDDKAGDRYHIALAVQLQALARRHLLSDDWVKPWHVIITMNNVGREFRQKEFPKGCRVFTITSDPQGNPASHRPAPYWVEWDGVAIAKPASLAGIEYAEVTLDEMRKLTLEAEPDASTTRNIAGDIDALLRQLGVRK